MTSDNASRGWQPIETAPLDRRVLLFRPAARPLYQISIGRWNCDSHSSNPRPYWRGDHGFDQPSDQREIPPTRWMEIPDPPD
jgi:hypothetical protein